MMETGSRKPSPRVLAVCGNMVVVFGMERMTFEILRVLRDSGAAVHCILNDWDSGRIESMAESIGASCSTGFYRYGLRRTANPLKWISYAAGVFRTSGGLLRECWKFRPTHVFVPDFVAVLKNAPVLALLRVAGVPVVMRSPTNPTRGRFYRWLWRWGISPLVTSVIVPSKFTLSRCEEVGVGRKTKVIRNTVPSRFVHDDIDCDIIALARSRRTLLCIGQIAPFKGTHIAVDAMMTLVERGDDVQLIVAGPKPRWPPEYVRYYETMRDGVAARGHGERVHFVGPVSNVSGLMETCYLLVAPIPEEESFCLVVLEAKCSGLPVVAFARGAIPELVEHERTGYLCHGVDHESLLEGIDFFLSDREAHRRASCLSRRACEEPSHECAPESFARAWRAVFSS